jgi:hypothetical protein
MVKRVGVSRWERACNRLGPSTRGLGSLKSERGRGDGTSGGECFLLGFTVTALNLNRRGYLAQGLFPEKELRNPVRSLGRALLIRGGRRFGVEGRAQVQHSRASHELRGAGQTHPTGTVAEDA